MSKKFAVFDIDGTLYRGVFFGACVEIMIARNIIPNSYQEQAELYKKAWQQREHPDSYKRFMDYLIGVWQKHMSEVPIHTFESIAKEVVDEQKGNVYTYTRDLVKRLKADGYTLIAISGSFKEAVEPFATHYGFDIIVGEHNLRTEHRLTGEVEMPTFIDKHLILEKIVKEHGLEVTDSYGVGDTYGDSSMLEYVEHSIAFNPEIRLFNEARNKGWKIVVERKNVVYELEANNGSYVLA
jgi:HAD superfamily hydrolase (TIGR01490 family)